VRYVLFGLENQKGGNAYDFEEHNAAIGHILPENPSEGWEQMFAKNTMDDYTFRIGNGCRLAWLVDADAQTVYIYRPGAEVEVVQGFAGPLSGGEVLPGFSLDLSQLI
jgi:hypothetical protein